MKCFDLRRKDSSAPSRVRPWEAGRAVPLRVADLSGQVEKLCVRGPQVCSHRASWRRSQLSWHWRRVGGQQGKGRGGLVEV